MANDLLRRRREAIPSPSGSGLSMTRAELAEAVNQYVWNTTGKPVCLDAETLARYERGQIRWPGKVYRAALRTILKVDADADLGFHPTRRGRAARNAIEMVMTDSAAVNEAPAETDLGVIFADDLDDARTTAVGLWRFQATNPEAVSALPFVRAAAAEAGWRWRLDPRDVTAAHRGQRRVTLADVELLRACQKRFVSTDRRQGGHARVQVTRWLHREVEPMLHGTYTDRVGRLLFAAVAELTNQVAFMSFDAGDHGIAQRHFIQALRLAKAADDSGLGAHILANMSTQAVYLKQPREAVRLARAAIDSGQGRLRRPVMARLHSAEAGAHALAGDARSCGTALWRAEQGGSDVAEQDQPSWAGYFTGAHLAGTAVRCLVDLGQVRDALGYADQALNLGEGSVRTRALHTALIAGIYALGHAPEPEYASELGSRALQLARGLRSRRVADRMADLVRQVGAYRGIPSVDEFLERARGYAALTGRK